MKIVTPAERAVVKKDFGEVWDSKMARNTMLVVPIVMTVVVPVLFLVIVCFVPQNQVNGIDQMMKLLPPEVKGYGFRQCMFYLMTNSLFPMFFLMIPLMASSVCAASSFVGEKERHTLETLMLTPLGVKRIFKAKILGCVLLSAVTTAISFVTFSVTMTVGDILLGLPFFLDWNWLVLVLLLAPALTVFGVVFMVLVSAKSKSYIESIQTSGYLILPVVLVFVGQFAGLFRLSALILLLAAAGIAALDAVVWIISARSFTAEKLLR